jgi:peroxiredoxin
MKRTSRLLATLALPLILGVCSLYAGQFRQDSKIKAADFILQDLQQNVVILSSYQGKQPVVLFFWTTWCPYCRQELLSLNELSPQLVKQGCEVLAINVEEPAYRVGNFIKKYGIHLRVLLDKDAQVSWYSYGILGVPTYFLVNKKGDIVFNGNHFPKERYQELIFK